MPLKKGSSKKTISSNIGTLVGDYKETGKIGTSKPASKAKAVKQAVAISLGKAGKAKPVKMRQGGELKAVDAKAKPGLAKLPTGVRNKMGYMKDGGDVMSSKVTYVKKKDGNKRVKIC